MLTYVNIIAHKYMKTRLLDIKSLQLEDCLSLTTLSLMLGLHTPTYLHCKDVAISAGEFGQFLGLSKESIKLLILSGFLHDIGKYYVSPTILDKTEPLTSDDWVNIKKHTQVDGDMLDIKEESVISIIQRHHEHLDGSGYHLGLFNKDIPYLARVIQLVDIYDALTHIRSYKPKFTKEKALKIMLKETEKGWYDPLLVNSFIEFINLKNS